MKKRIFSMILALTMVFSLFSGLTITASAADVTSGFTPATAGTYEKVTDVSTLAAGDEILIVQESHNVTISTTQNNNNRGAVSKTITDSQIEITASSTAQSFILEAADSGFYLLAGTGLYLYAPYAYGSTKTNALRTTDNKSTAHAWTITADAVCAVDYTNRGNLQYNSSNALFACYGSGTTYGTLSIYKLDSGGEPPHTHTWGEGVETTAATCTAEGVMTYTCTDPDCGATKTEAIPKTGHVDEDDDDECDVCAHPVYTPDDTLSNGELVVIYNSDADRAMSGTATAENRLAAVTVNNQEGILGYDAANAEPLELTVIFDGDTDFYLKSGDKYLTTGAAGGSLALTSSHAHGLWYLGEQTDGGVMIFNKDAFYQNDPIALEFHNGYFTGYGYSGQNTGKYAMKLYTRPGTENPQPPHDYVDVYVIDKTSDNQQELHIWAWGKEGNIVGNWDDRPSFTHEGDNAISDKEHDYASAHHYYKFKLDVTDYGTGFLITTPNGQTGNLALTDQHKADGIAVFYLYNNNGIAASAGDTEIWKLDSHTEADCNTPETYHYVGILNNGTYDREVGEALNHAWGDPTYTWAADNLSCTAEVVCGNNPLHKITENGEVTKDPGEDGVTYTAVFATDRYPFEARVKFVPFPDFGNMYFEKVTDDESLTNGDYLIVYEAGGLAFDGSLATLDAVENTIDVEIDAINNKIAANETTMASVFTIEAMDGGYSIKSASGQYIGQTSNANGMAVSDTDAYVNAISIADGDADIVSGGAYLRFNSASNQMRFRYYKSSSYTDQKPVALYKLVDNTPPEHEHVVVYVDAVAATCTVDGRKAYYYCSAEGCDLEGKYFSDEQLTQELERIDVPAPGHTYKSVVTPPTCTKDGYTTYTCSVCEHSYVAEETEATGHDWGTPSYEWAKTEDGWSCTGTVICAKDEAHTVTETVEAVDVPVDATHAAPGKHVWTANFENDVFETQTKDGDAIPQLEPYDGYYLLGSYNQWEIDENAYRFEPNPEDPNEFMLSCTLAVGDEVKAAHVVNGEADQWFPNQGDNYVVNAGHAGIVTVYFSETKRDDWNEFGGFIFITAPIHTHTPELVPEVPPTCTVPGTVAHYHCSDPNCELYNGFFSDETLTTVIEETEIPVTSHTLEEHEAAAPTCTEPGNSAYWKCTVCGKFFSDANGENEIEENSWVLEATGHSPKPITTENVVEPTCTAAGSYDEVVYCSVCNAEISRETKTVDPLGHNWGDWEQTSAPSCEETGEKSRECSRCHETQIETIPALGHDWDEPTYEWDEDFSACTAKAICKRDPSHEAIEYESAQYEIVTPATFDAEGLGRWTVTFPNNNLPSDLFVPQTKDVVLPKLEHNWIDIYLIDGNNDEAANYYVWNDSTQEENADFPGEAMEKLGIDMNGHPYFKATVDAAVYDRLVLNNGEGLQTANLTFISDAGSNKYVVYSVPEGFSDLSTVADIFPDDLDHKTVHEPTCTEAGYTVFNGLLTEATETLPGEPATGHEWGAPSYVWTETEDGWSCTATRVCAKDESHVETETVIANYAVTTQPGFGTSGVGTYTATFENEAFEDQTKTVDISALPALPTATVTEQEPLEGKPVFELPLDLQNPTPVATVEEIAAVYKFATTPTEDQAAYFAQWYCDYRVTFTDALDAGTFGLYGAYGTYDVSFLYPANVAAGSEVYLLQTLSMQTLKYYEVVGIGEFTCGAFNLIEENKDRAMKVELVIWDPTDPDTKYVLASENYRFGDPTAILCIEHSFDEVTYVWADDYSTCTATAECSVCHYPVTETVSTTGVVTKPATCEEAGAKTWTATFENEAFETQTKSEEIPATGHAWGEPSYVWADDNSTVTATRTCANDPDHVETETVNTTNVITVVPTLEASGVRTYTATFENEAFATQTKDVPFNGEFIDVYVVDMTSSNDVRIWAWGEAGSIVPNVVGIWDNRPKMENIGACYANVETTPLACTYYLYKLEKNCFGTGLKFSTPAGETGTINYVSDAADSERVVYYLLSDNGLQASNDVSKSIWLFKEDHPATCETGSYQTFVNLFDDTDFKDSAPANDALGHNWGAPSYEWAADNSSVTATRVCSNDPAHVETETVSTTVTTTAATCEEAGAKTWTAAFENEAFETQTKSETIPATGHAWGEPSYVWADDNSSVTATRVCGNDPEHVETETVNATSEITTAATCETAGEATYTATFENPAFETQTKTAEIPATGHAWGEPSYVWADDNSSVTATRVCGNDPAHVETETANVTVTTTEATCEEAGAKTWTATFENEAFETQTKSETIPATGHDWGEPSYVWADDNSTVTATRVCGNDPEHVETETANVTYEVTTEPTVESPGVGTWTATFTNEAFTTQTKDVEIPKLLADGVYLVGTFNNWKPNETTDKFIVNPNNQDEYQLATNLTAGEEIKVIVSENGNWTWYGKGGDNYTVDAAHSGNVTIYFKTSYDSAWAEFGGYFYIAAAPQPMKITLYSDISLGIDLHANFKVGQSDVESFDHWYIEVTRTRPDGTVETKRFSIEDGNITNTRNPVYLAVYSDIAAKEMGDHFQATFHGYDAEGNEIGLSDTVEYTLRDYILAELMKEDNDRNMRTLTADLLNYGAAAQIYFDYDAENLVNKNLSEAQQNAMNEFATDGEAEATLVNSQVGPNIYSSVSILNRIVLSLTVRNVGTPEKVQIEIKNNETGAVKDVVDAVSFNVNNKTFWKVKYSGFDAKDMRTAFDFTVLADDEETGTPITWSVEGYVREGRLNENSTEAERNLLNAMLNYVDAVARVFPNS